MKKIYSVIVALVLICIIMITFFLLSDYKKVSLIEEESYFRSHKVNSSKVFFDYLITLENGSNEPKEVRITANLKKEYDTGLIEEPQLEGRNKQNGSHSFIIPAETTKACEVEFIGTFRGNYHRASKELPELFITEIDR